jgi:hypothetical protein
MPMSRIDQMRLQLFNFEHQETPMKLATSLAVALAVAITTAQSWAATPAEQDAHHPAGAASTNTAKTMPSNSKLAMAGMDSQMKSMQEMHNKMMAAKTPEERNALMAEHMKTMQDGMTMMNGMSSSGMSGMSGMPKDMATRHQMMEKHMEMMEKHMEMMQSMMQMMMDRLPPVPAK